MARYNLGQVAIVNKGAWSASANYAPLNTVTHNGGSFMAIDASANIEPGVAASWDTYWVPMAKGIKTVAVTALSESTAQVNITLSDGTVIVGGTYNTATVAPGSIGAAQLAARGVTTEKVADGAITGEKLASTVLPANVGFKFGTAVPTTADISNGQVYLKYEA